MEQERHIQDRILEYVYDPKVEETEFRSAKLSKLFEISEHQLIRAIRGINTIKKGFIIINKGFGDSQFTIYQDSDLTNEVSVFLSSGGFTEYYQQVDNEEARQKKKEQLEIENLVATTRQAKAAMRDSRVAIVVSILGAIMGAMALYLQWKGK